jgi:hypothetical protein
MKTPAILAFLSLSLVSVSPLPMFAQTAPAAAEVVEVEVSGVKFDNARFGRDSWTEATVDLAVRPGGRASSGRFVDRVRVTLSLGAEASGEKGEKRTVFFRASAEAITLEGGRAFFRFYLPPEVVKRDKLRPEYHVVELEVGGKQLPPVKANVSSNITSADMLKNFLAKVSSDGGANDGVLMPQHLTPFAYDEQRPAPTVLRREPQR